VNLAGSRGRWKCFAGCGSGDLVAFHMRLRGVPFVEAVRDLCGVRA
jgi:DNA primase